MDKHLSTQFDTELSTVSTRVLEMGGLAESQVNRAVYALTHLNGEVASEVLHDEDRINRMEVEIEMRNGRDEPVLRWALRRALPVKFKAADLDARGTKIGIEELHLAHEGLVLVS